MKVKGFGARPSRNVRSGGQRSSFDQYHKAFKGTERNPRAEEYASRNIPEYHHYPEVQDLTSEEDQQKDAKARRERNEKRRRRQRLGQQLAVLVVGSVIIVNTYNARVAKRAEIQAAELEDADGSGTSGDGTDGTGGSSGQDGSSDAAVSSDVSISWKWSEDGRSATLVITDSSGDVIDEVEATVAVSEEPATCKTDGRLISTATAVWEGQTYSDVRDEVLPALGHSFDDGKEVVLENGRTSMQYECTRCHERFDIITTVEEE